MFGLHWFHGISVLTPIRDIGWTYVILLGLVVFLAKFAKAVVKSMKEEA